jgi:hypothetical protein
MPASRGRSARVLRDNGLSLVLLLLFLGCWCAQIAVGLAAYNEDLTRAGMRTRPPLGVSLAVSSVSCFAEALAS